MKFAVPAYIKDAKAIYRQSFAAIRREANLSRFPGLMEKVAVRMIHACGMVDLAQDIIFSAGAAEAGQTALAKGAAIFCDSRMVAEGITRSRLPAQNRVISMLNAPDLSSYAENQGTTRSAAALDFYKSEFCGNIIAIGNAPTALFHLLELLEAGAPKPALILGLPVGFVGAAESKRVLEDYCATKANAPAFITLRGRRGGSAITVAAINALAQEAE